jgi:hypothetical protein
LTSLDSLPGCKPVSVPLRAAVIHLGQASLPGSSDLPESETERTAPPLLFGLAPRGVCPANRITPAAVRSYRTFSPLPLARRYIFCGTFRKRRFERISPAVSRHAVLWRPDFPPLFRSDYPPGKLINIIARQGFRAPPLALMMSDFFCPFVQFGSILFIAV